MALVSIILSVVITDWDSVAHAQPAAQKAPIQTSQDLKHSLREHLFLGTQLGFTRRQAVFASDAIDAANSTDEFRIRISGSTLNTGTLGTYFGLSLFGRPSIDATQNLTSPFADPYDELNVTKNVRLHNAYVEYAAKDLDENVRLRFKAGRLAQLDPSGQLLICDGISLKYLASHAIMVSAFGGARARLDDDTPFKERNLDRQICAGTMTRWQKNEWFIRGGYQFEQIHRAQIDGGYSTETLDLSIGAEILASSEEESTDSAILVRLDGAWLSPDQRWATEWLLLSQIGTDPRPYGRADFSQTPQLPQTIHASRLYLGAADPHIRAHVDSQYWLTPTLALQAGGFGRVLLDSQDLDSLRPQLTEFWLGPEMILSRGFRAGIETELAFEEAGEQNVFANTGDAVTQRLGLRAYSELPIQIGTGLSVAIRPHLLAAWSDTDSALSTTTNQARYSGGLLALLVWDQYGRLGAHYEIEVLPELGANSVENVQRAELWIEGTY